MSPRAHNCTTSVLHAQRYGTTTSAMQGRADSVRDGRSTEECSAFCGFITVGRILSAFVQMRRDLLKLCLDTPEPGPEGLTLLVCLLGSFR